MNRVKGFTLIELLIVVVIFGLLTSLALPSINSYIDKRKIINAAEAVYSQLQFARSQAISRSETINVNFAYSDNADASTWLMGLRAGGACDPTLVAADADWANSCVLVTSDGDADEDTGDGTVDTDDLVFHVISGADFNEVMLDADGTGTGGLPDATSFNPTRGTADQVTINLTYLKGDSQYEMRVIVGRIGRVRICTPTDNGRAVPGYSEC